MALVCDVNVAGQTLVAYNLHLESRGNDQLRRAQLTEVLDDTQRYIADVPLIVAGDMNFDVSRGDASERIRDRQFRNAFTDGAPMATAPSSFLHPGRPIDWILTRGSVQETDVYIDRSVDASDHFPLSLTLALRPREAQNTAGVGAASSGSPMRGDARSIGEELPFHE